MNRKSLDPRDRLFFVALIVQLTVSAVLGVAIVRAIDRAGKVQAVGGALPVSRPSASAGPTAGTGPTTRTHTSVIGGRAGSRTGGGSTGVTAGEIKIGGVFTLSGPADATPAVHAVQAYFNMINEAGGVFGRRLTYVVRDDKFDPAIGYQGTKDLIENQKVFAGVSWTAPNTENQQTINYLEKNGVPLVGNFGQPAEFTSPISYSFTLPWEYSPPLSVRYMANNVGQKKLCVVWVHLSAEIDNIVVRTANEEAARDGAQVIYTEAADVAKPSYDDTVANCQQNAIQKTGSRDGVGMVAILDAFSLKRYWLSFARQTWRPPQVGYAFAMDPQPSGAIPSGYEDVYAVQEMELPSNPTPEVGQYLDGMKKYYPGDMDKLSWATELAWLGAKMFVEALRDAGANPTRQGVMDALNAMTRFDSGFAPPYTIRSERRHVIAECMKAATFTSARKWVQSSDWYCM